MMKKKYEKSSQERELKKFNEAGTDECHDDEYSGFQLSMSLVLMSS